MISETGMDELTELLQEMTAGELVEMLLVNKDKNMSDFIWMEQAELVLRELKGRLRDGENMDVKTILKILRQSFYK